MEQEISNQVELTLRTDSEDFVRVISEKLAFEEILIFPTKKIFMGSINETHFRLFRLKRFSWFDYNTTEFKGEIKGNGETTRLSVDFSLIWIYKHLLILVFLVFGIIDILIISTNNVKWNVLVIFLFVESLILLQVRIQSKIRFKKDKQRYIEILKSLFEIIELKNKY